jgi:hypothetical protein
VLAPIETAGLTLDDLATLKERVRGTIAEARRHLLEELRAPQGTRVHA